MPAATTNFDKLSTMIKSILFRKSRAGIYPRSKTDLASSRNRYLTENDFWSPVISGHHIRRHHEGGSGRAGQAEVQDLKRAVGTNHNIGRLQVLKWKEKKVNTLSHPVADGREEFIF